MTNTAARRILYTPAPEWYVTRICFKTGPPRAARPACPAPLHAPTSEYDPAPSRAHRAHRDGPLPPDALNTATAPVPRQPPTAHDAVALRRARVRPPVPLQHGGVS